MVLPGWTQEDPTDAVDDFAVGRAWWCRGVGGGGGAAAKCRDCFDFDKNKLHTIRVHVHVDWICNNQWEIVICDQRHSKGSSPGSSVGITRVTTTTIITAIPRPPKRQIIPSVRGPVGSRSTKKEVVRCVGEVVWCHINSNARCTPLVFCV